MTCYCSGDHWYLTIYLLFPDAVFPCLLMNWYDGRGRLCVIDIPLFVLFCSLVQVVFGDTWSWNDGYRVRYIAVEWCVVLRLPSHRFLLMQSFIYGTLRAGALFPACWVPSGDAAVFCLFAFDWADCSAALERSCRSADADTRLFCRRYSDLLLISVMILHCSWCVLYVVVTWKWWFWFYIEVCPSDAGNYDYTCLLFWWVEGVTPNYRCSCLHYKLFCFSVDILLLWCMERLC